MGPGFLGRPPQFLHETILFHCIMSEGLDGPKDASGESQVCWNKELAQGHMDSDKNSHALLKKRKPCSGWTWARDLGTGGPQLKASQSWVLEPF